MRARWAIVGVFLLSSTLNYLDRQSLATLAPWLRSEFHLNNADYGLIVAAFSITYAICAPLAGLLIDRIGLNRGIALAVGLWSLASIATGLTRGLTGLVACRAWLGFSEAGGIPGAGKAIASYLEPEERALGNGLNQAAVFAGLIAAPPLATWLAVRSGWRSAFVVIGVAGLLWIPLWLWISRRAPAAAPAPRAFGILRDRRMWGLVVANALSMMTYSLWTNWTTIYLVDATHLGPVDAARFAWIPPVFAMSGGFAGGGLSLLWAKRGHRTVSARMRVCLLAALFGLVIFLAPLTPGPASASAAISLSIFAASAFSVNLYTIPLDTFGAAHAAFTVSLLASSYGAMQTVVSPLFGRIIDHHGFAPVCAIAGIAGVAGYGVLRITQRGR